jgi:predicted DNA-binding transcriptional regulator AlpA
MDEFMTTEEVAGVVRRSPETIRWFRHVGKGPRSFKIGRRVLYSRIDVEQWIAEAREEGVS